jgi:Mrp family chromosome partitioning ATPase
MLFMTGRNEIGPSLQTRQAWLKGIKSFIRIEKKAPPEHPKQTPRKSLSSHVVAEEQLPAPQKRSPRPSSQLPFKGIRPRRQTRRRYRANHTCPAGGIGAAAVVVVLRGGEDGASTAAAVAAAAAAAAAGHLRARCCCPCCSHRWGTGADCSYC